MQAYAVCISEDISLRRRSSNMVSASVLWFLVSVGCLTVLHLNAYVSEKPWSDPKISAHIVAYWPFIEEAGQDRVDVTSNHYHLREDGGKIERSTEGIVGPFSAYLTPGKRFVLPRSEAGFLNFHGKSNINLTIAAWIKRMPYCGFPNYTNPYPCCEFIAGIFNESSNHRQYGMFLNLHSFNSSNGLCALISDNGGDTPGHKGCVSGSYGATRVPYFQWQCVVISYDNRYVKSYLNGKLDGNGKLNPYYYPNGIFDPSTNGADFTVGGNDAFGEKHNYFHGLIGGLMILNATYPDSFIPTFCH